MASLNPLRTVLVPAIGGLVLGLLTLGITRIRPRRTVDPIEANALFGGRMSMNGSLIVVLQTIISNGVGASVGLEAGYTQIGSAIASRWGHAFRVRRNDLRLLVGCGAAAAIAGAFNAPLTGSFYAFELVIGTYTLASFAPVAVAALVSQAVVQALGGSIFDLTPAGSQPYRAARLHPDPRARHAVRPARYLHHARRHDHRGAVSQKPGPRLAASRHRRTRDRHAGAGHARGPLLRSRRAGAQLRGA